MTMTTNDTAAWRPKLDRRTALKLAADEYNRYLDLLRTLTAEEWSRQTDCAAWDVRAMAAHCLGMAEMSASQAENERQIGTAFAKGGVFIDALTGLQVDERADMSTDEIVERYAEITPQSALGREHTPQEVRESPMPLPQHVNGKDEAWTVGFLVDVILTRDTWMHRVDTCRATGRPMLLTADHDGVLVADVVAEWAERHGSAYTLHLDGPTGGSWSSGNGGSEYRLDAVEFCRILSGRATGDGLLATEVPF
jgi:uncharacterized protein (TIGR03083 family)